MSTLSFEATVDGRRRLTLGQAAKHDRYLVQVRNDGDILLTPLVSVPARELDLWNDPELLASVTRGLQQAAAGELHDLGDFTQFAEEAEDGE